MADVSITISIPDAGAQAGASPGGVTLATGGPPPVALTELEAAAGAEAAAPAPTEDVAVATADTAPAPLPLEQLQAYAGGAGEPPGPDLGPEETAGSSARRRKSSGKSKS